MSKRSTKIYQVEDILQCFSVDGIMYYEVKWKGYKRTTYQPETNITIKQAIKELIGYQKPIHRPTRSSIKKSKHIAKMKIKNHQPILIDSASNSHEKLQEEPITSIGEFQNKTIGSMQMSESVNTVDHETQTETPLKNKFNRLEKCFPTAAETQIIEESVGNIQTDRIKQILNVAFSKEQVYYICSWHKRENGDTPRTSWVSQSQIYKFGLNTLIRYLNMGQDPQLLRST